MTFLEMAEQRAVITLCVDIRKTLIETHNFLNQSENHCNASRLLVFKWHSGFSHRKDSLEDDLLEGRPFIYYISEIAAL
jgi:hypothetical protein